jgi:hypothetical protein
MKKLFALALLGLFAWGSALAADTSAKDTKTGTDAKNSQQEKMKACNEQAADKKGDERKAFMKTCLSAKPPEKPKSKMAMCNEKTKGMSKADADKARSECMKG